MEQPTTIEASPVRFPWRTASALGLALALSACASGPQAQAHDPLEPLNRRVWAFNETVDTALLKPVATAYRDITPSPVRTGVGNFFANLGDVWSGANATLQLRPREATENFLRFGVNTTLGFGGIFDIASEMGIERTRLDLGHTLGRWGVPAGPYVVLPLLGPSSVRDATGLGVEMRTDPVNHADHNAVRNSLTALKVVDTRARLLRATALLDGASLDSYSFTRDVYLRRRQSQIDDIVEQGVGLRNGTEDTHSQD